MTESASVSAEERALSALDHLEAAHVVDESVATRDIMEAARTSVRLLARWCGGANR